MISETASQSYRGVTCLHCKQAIPVSALVASRQADVRSVETRLQKSQVFHLRCPGCGKEKPYKISEIREFTDVPAAQPLSARPAHLDDKSRVANA